MNLGIKLNLNAIANHTFTETEVLSFTSISDLDNYAYIDTEFVRRIRITVTSTSKKLEIFTTSLLLPSHELDDNAIVNASTDGRYIVFNCSITDSSNAILLKWISLGLIEVNQFGKTTIFAYRLNDEADHITKSLTFVTVLEGKFTAPVGIKTLELDVIDYNIDNAYNYVYIPKLKRYYYIDNVVLTTKDYTRLVLKEDVLMSWKSLILSQSAFVTRYGGSTMTNLVDNRLPLEDSQRVEKHTFTNTVAQESKVNVTIDYDLTNGIRNFMIVVKDTWNDIYPSGAKVTSIDSGNLPTIRPHDIPNQNIYFMSPNYLGDFLQPIMNDDTTASFLTSIIWLPFDPSTLLNAYCDDTNGGQNSLYIGSKELKVEYGNNHFVDYTEVVPVANQPKVTFQDKEYKTITQIPYIVVFDGKYVAFDDWKAREPYSYYEIHVPFVGYVKMEGKDFINQRIIIYYSLDVKSGMSTCYIYNYDKHAIIYSTTCQLGIKLELTTSNTLENTKQKQSAELNMILGLVSSAVSVGIGVASENPVAIVGGVLSASKTIASNVNINRQIFERAQTSYGSNDGALFDSYNVFIRVTYHKPLSIDSTTYAKLQGYPYNNYVSSLTSLTTGNYIEVGDIHFDYGNENIYTEEVTEIVALLKNGVIL